MSDDLLPDPTLEPLRAEAKRRVLTFVRDDFIKNVSEMPREELQRRILVQADWHGHYAACLDGIPEIQHIRGGGIDKCRQPDDIRRIVLNLLNKETS